MHRRTYRIAWMLSLLVIVGLACNLFSKVGQTAQDIQSIGTDIGKGKQLISTVQPFITQVEGLNLLETLQSFTKNEVPGALETMQAVATVQGVGMVETVQAYATDHAPSLKETGQAMATQLSPGEVPEDIPVVEGDKTEFYSSQQIVSYGTPLDFQTVLDFYKNEMPAKGWTLVENAATEMENFASLPYDKPTRRTTINITVNQFSHNTVVFITISNK
jgi:hypothetical protein